MSDPRRTPAQRMIDVLGLNAVDLLHYFERRAGRNAAADLLSETMITAWRRSDSLPPCDEEARMWLFGVARNILANADRSERRRWRLANRLRMMTRPGDMVVASPDEGAEVRDAVERLPPNLAELIRLVHWDGLTLVEAGAHLGIPASTARGRYQTARQLLRETLSADPVTLHSHTAEALRPSFVRNSHSLLANPDPTSD